MHQRNQYIQTGKEFIGKFYAPRSERSWIVNPDHQENTLHFFFLFYFIIFFQLVHSGFQIKCNQERPCQAYCFLLFSFNLVTFANGMTMNLAMTMTPHLQFPETASDSLEHTPLNVR